jgi:hypothetical protein
MVKVILSHDVANFQNWKKGFDAGEALRQQSGMKTIGVFNDIENPNHVTIIADFPNKEAVTGFINNPNLKNEMKNAGVVGAPEVHILNQSH